MRKGRRENEAKSTYKMEKKWITKSENSLQHGSTRVSFQKQGVGSSLLHILMYLQPLMAAAAQSHVESGQVVRGVGKMCETE